MLALHRPPVDLWFKQFAYGPIEIYPAEAVPQHLPLARARALAREHARLQKSDLARLDQAERRAQALGIGRDDISRAFGRVAISELPLVYDAVPMLDLPPAGQARDSAAIRSALSPYFAPPPP
jgi:hypothetical protein